MKKILLYSLVLLFCAGVSNLSAQQSKKISLQGFLKDANGKAVADGMQDITFKLYSVATGGTAAWTETQPINVFGGVYSTHLGSVANPVDNLDWGRSTYFVGVTVQGIELTPRTELTFAPYSLGSPKAQEVVCSGAVGDVKYSILNPTQFAAQNGDCWVPMDGRPITGSKLATILTANGQSTNIINAGGHFIRSNEFENSSNYDPNRSYSTTVVPNIQNQDFKDHNHYLSIAVSVSGNTNETGAHRHRFNNATDQGGETDSGEAERYQRPNHRDDDTSEAGSHSHTVNASGTVSGYSYGTGGTETRPVNINLWTYIRIN